MPEIYLDAKNQLHPFLLFLDIAKTFYFGCNIKLTTFGTLGMPGYDQQKWYYQLVQNFDVYLQTKDQLDQLGLD